MLGVVSCAACGSPAALQAEPRAEPEWAFDSRSRAAAASDCPAFQRTAASTECLEAVQVAAQRAGLEARGNLKSVSMSSADGVVPYGCSYSTASNCAIFNSNPAGGNGWLPESDLQAAYKLVCIATSPQPQQPPQQPPQLCDSGWGTSDSGC